MNPHIGAWFRYSQTTKENSTFLTFSTFPYRLIQFPRFNLIVDCNRPYHGSLTQIYIKQHFSDSDLRLYTKLQRNLHRSYLNYYSPAYINISGLPYVTPLFRCPNSTWPNRWSPIYRQSLYQRSDPLSSAHPLPDMRSIFCRYINSDPTAPISSQCRNRSIHP